MSHVGNLQLVHRTLTPGRTHLGQALRTIKPDYGDDTVVSRYSVRQNKGNDRKRKRYCQAIFLVLPLNSVISILIISVR